MRATEENTNIKNGVLTDNFTFRELEKLYFKDKTPRFVGDQFIESANYGTQKHFEFK
jgi:hypothetical protein